VTTWAIGDLQGCWETFAALLERIAFDPARDRLWLVGDLVNRGPGSLEVLRWCVQHDSAVTAVLGNHDLHLLATAAGLRKRKPRDTLGAVLDAPDRDELLAWLRRRPLLHVEGDHVLVHAGIPPWWSLAGATEQARALEKRIRKGKLDLLVPPREDLLRWKRKAPNARQVALAAFVTMRCLDAQGRLLGSFKGAPEDRPAGAEPWWARWSGPQTVVFGHWAALGFRCGHRWLALDSGCVWGRALTAVCLEDGRIASEPARDARVAECDSSAS